MHIEQFAHVDRVDYKGREFAHFYAQRNNASTGYVVMGRCVNPDAGYSGNLVKICATRIKRCADGTAYHVGFRREYDVYRFALYLNGTDLGTIK